MSKDVTKLKPFSLQINKELFEPATPEEKRELVVMRQGTSLWKDAVRRFKKNAFAMIALLFVILMIFYAFAGPLCVPYQYDQQNRGDENQGPNAKHLFGTDKFGRDLFVRNMYGTQISLTVGLLAAFLTFVIGSLYGAIAGFAGGRVDNIMMRIVDILYTLPDLLLVVLLSIVLKKPMQDMFSASPLLAKISDLGPAFFSMLVVFALLYWGTMARIVRSEVMRIKEQEYVLAARALGARSGKIILRHLLPNAIGAIIVTTTMQIPAAIFTESFLSFIGLGISAPRASLGSMVTDALSGIYTYPLRVVFPAVTIALIILAFNTVGDALRDVLDPRMKK